jgi:hypothetical protein
MTDFERAKYEWRMYTCCSDARNEDLARIRLNRWFDACEKVVEDLMVLRRGRAKLSSGQRS